MERYFDHAATTPVDPRVFEAMRPYFCEQFANAHSIHHLGTQARYAVEKAREQVACLIGAEDPSQIIFTSGATESNNWVLRSFKNALVSPYEHSSIREPAIRLGHSFLLNGIEEVGESLPLISVMAVNNETGHRFDVERYRSHTVKLHSDLTQAVGKLPIDLSFLDYASFSAHKFYGPKGIGALYVRDDSLEPLLIGGGQENGQRGGTLNVPAIVGFGAAAELAMQEREENEIHACALNRVFRQAMDKSGCEHLWISPLDGSPYILSVAFPNIEAQAIVVELDRYGFAVSSGAACSAGSTETSHVLLALGIAESYARGALRISFGKNNTEEATLQLVSAVEKTVRSIAKM